MADANLSAPLRGESGDQLAVTAQLGGAGAGPGVPPPDLPPPAEDSPSGPSAPSGDRAPSRRASVSGLAPPLGLPARPPSGAVSAGVGPRRSSQPHAGVNELVSMFAALSGQVASIADSLKGFNVRLSNVEQLPVVAAAPSRAEVAPPPQASSPGGPSGSGPGLASQPSPSVGAPDTVVVPNPLAVPPATSWGEADVVSSAGAAAAHVEPTRSNPNANSRAGGADAPLSPGHDSLYLSATLGATRRDSPPRPSGLLSADGAGALGTASHTSSGANVLVSAAALKAPTPTSTELRTFDGRKAWAERLAAHAALYNDADAALTKAIGGEVAYILATQVRGDVAAALAECPGWSTSGPNSIFWATPAAVRRIVAFLRGAGDTRAAETNETLNAFADAVGAPRGSISAGLYNGSLYEGCEMPWPAEWMPGSPAFNTRFAEIVERLTALQLRHGTSDVQVGTRSRHHLGRILMQHTLPRVFRTLLAPYLTTDPENPDLHDVVDALGKWRDSDEASVLKQWFELSSSGNDKFTTVGTKKSAGGKGGGGAAGAGAVAAAAQTGASGGSGAVTPHSQRSAYKLCQFEQGDEKAWVRCRFCVTEPGCAFKHTKRYLQMYDKLPTATSSGSVGGTEDSGAQRRGRVTSRKPATSS